MDACRRAMRGGAGSCVKLLARRARDFTFRMYALCPGMDPKGVTNQATQNTMTPGPLLTERGTHRKGGGVHSESTRDSLPTPMTRGAWLTVLARCAGHAVPF